MKKVSKAILILLGVVLGLVVALLVGLNLYVQSPGAQARIQEELSKALRLPLKITNTSVSPWSDLRITGISIPSGETNFLEASSFTARYRLLPLLEGKLIITEMRVESPKVVWTQNAAGKWKLPEPEEAAEVARKESKKGGSSTEENPAAAPDQSAEKPTKEKKDKVAKKDKDAGDSVKKKDFAVIVNRFDIKDGVFELLDKDQHHVASFTGVNMTYTKLTAEQVEGVANIAKAVWADGLTLENVRTPFSFISSNHEFWLPEITASVAGGSLKGNYRSRAEAEHTPFNTTLEFEQVNLDRLMTQSGGEAGQATGELRGKIEMRGETDRMDRAEGQGHLDLRNGQLRQLELFQTIGQSLGLRELSNLRLQEGHAEFSVAGEKIRVERLLLATTDLQMTSKGTVQLNNKKVALDAQLSVEESLVKQLPDLVRDSFAVAENNRRTIDFNVTGTTDKLKTNLVDKLIGQKITSQFGNLLGNLFGNEKKAEDDKKKKEEEERKKAEKKEKDKKKKDKDKDKEKDKAQDKVAPAPDAVPTAPTPSSPAPTTPNP